VLASAGFHVSEATDGEDAIRQVSRLGHGFDVVLLDQNMPGMSGTETFRHLREHISASRIVLVSGMLALEPERASALGAQRFLYKPFAAEELIQAVNDAVNG
jgi:two-component system, OmpR family, response regulator RegX3